MPLGRPTQDPQRAASLDGRRNSGETRIASWRPGTSFSSPESSGLGTSISRETSMTRSRSRAVSQPPQASDAPPRAQKRRATEIGGSSQDEIMVDPPEEEMKSEEGGHDPNKQVTRGWSYAGKLALVQKVLEFKVYTGCHLSRDEAFEKIRKSGLQDPSISEHFQGRTAMGMRSYFAKMRREAEKEKNISGRLSSVDHPSDPDYANWVVAMLKALREIAVYERTGRDKRGDAVSASNASSTASASSSSAASASNTGRNRRNSDAANKKSSANNNNNRGSKAHDGDGGDGGGGGGGQAGPSGDSEAGRVYVGHSKTLGLFTSERITQRIEEHGEMPPDFTYFREVQPIGFTGNDPPPPNGGGDDDDDQYGDGDGDDGTEYADGDGDDSDVILAGDRVGANPGKASACVRSPRSSKRSKGDNGDRVVTRAQEDTEKRQADEEARLRREADERKERELREDRRLLEEHKRWEQDRKDRMEREALEREDAQRDREERAAKEAADREERRHERELKADVEKARLAAEDRRQTQQHEMVMKVMEVMMKSSKE